MNSPDLTRPHIKPSGGVERKFVNVLPEELIEEDQAAHHSTTLSPDRTEFDEGWTEMLRAIKTIKRLQRQAPPLRPVSRDEKLPLSFAQQRLWSLHQLEPDSPAYNTARAYRVTGLLNVTALAQSLNEIVRRHEILRTTFPTIKGQPVQVIAPALPLWPQDEPSTWPVVDLQHLPVAEREAEALRMINEEIQQPINLAQGPLLRVVLLRLGPEEHMLLLVTHQILFAGQAWGGFNRELSALYEAFSAGKPSPLPELPIQYADFAVWQREWLRGEALETLLSYWKQQLGGNVPLLALPTDHPRPAVPTFQSGRQSLVLSQALTEALKATSQQRGVTLFTTLLAAFQTLLHRYTAQEDIIVFSSALGRNQLEIRKLIGLFTNFVPLRTDFSGNPSFWELLGLVRKVSLGAFAHQDLPFEQLMDAWQFKRSLNHTSPFQVMFIFQNTPSPSLKFPGLFLSPLEADIGMTKFDLSLSMANTERGLAGTLTYKTDLFNAATITRMLEHLQTLLQGIVAIESGSDKRLADLPCLVEAKQQQWLAWRDDGLVANARADGRTLPASGQARSELEKTFIAPQDTLEHELTKIWEQVLSVWPIGVRDNFFDLGGHSLLTARLFAQIKNLTGQNLHLATLFQAPTVEQLANILRQEGWSSPTPSLVALQPGGSKPPFFCLPGNLGNVFTDLGDLARYLGPDQPFYGLQDGVQNPAQIEALAAYYLDEIRVVQPQGPYLLGGVCSGGAVAFEMAQQLQAQGQPVALLALVETPQLQVPGIRSYFNFAVFFLRDLARRFGRHSRSVSQLSSVERRTYIRLKMKVFANLWALTRYVPQPYPGRLHFFRASESPDSPQDPRRLDWCELASGGAEVHIIPGTHNTITRTHDAIPEESHLRVLAEQLRACIDEALADACSS